MSYKFYDGELQSRFEEMKASTDLRTLKQDVALLRAILEQRLNFARNDSERISAFNSVAPMFGTLDKLVNSLDKLERRSGEVLEKEAVQKLVSDIVNVLAFELEGVPDRDGIVDRVARRMADVIAKARNVEAE